MATEDKKVENLDFNSYVEDKAHRANVQMIKKIDDKSFAFSTNKFFSYNPAKLAADEFNRCVEIYKERTPNQNMMNIMRLMQEIPALEMGHKEDLENLAIKLVREMYNVPDSLDLRAIINPNLDPDEECDSPEPEEELSDERKAALQPEIEKRRILNSLVHGAAVHQWTSAYFIVSEELNQLNPDLVAKYSAYSALLNYFNWQMYSEPMIMNGMMPDLQGINKVKIKEKKIEAKAKNFPVLVHELSKGVIDFLTSMGIPDISGDELTYYYKEADNYAHEQWHYCFGPTLWRALLESADVTSHDLPPIISTMSKMDYVDLSNFCIDVVFHAEETGNAQMKAVKKESF